MKFAKSQACQTQALMHPSQAPAPPAYSYYSPKKHLKNTQQHRDPKLREALLWLGDPPRKAPTDAIRSLKATVAKAHGYLSASVTCSFLVPKAHPPGPSYSATLSCSSVSCYLLFLLNTSVLCRLKKVKFAPSLVFKCIQQIAFIKRS